MKNKYRGGIKLEEIKLKKGDKVKSLGTGNFWNGSSIIGNPYEEGNVQLITKIDYVKGVLQLDGDVTCWCSINDWKIYKEKDDWNLADEIKETVSDDGFLEGIGLVDKFKTFIQKVKDDIAKKIVNKKIPTISIEQQEVDEIIDKRAGDL